MDSRLLSSRAVGHVAMMSRCRFYLKAGALTNRTILPVPRVASQQRDMHSYSVSFSFRARSTISLPAIDLSLFLLADAPEVADGGLGRDERGIMGMLFDKQGPVAYRRRITRSSQGRL